MPNLFSPELKQKAKDSDLEDLLSLAQALWLDNCNFKRDYIEHLKTVESNIYTEIIENLETEYVETDSISEIPQVFPEAPKEGQKHNPFIRGTKYTLEIFNEIDRLGSFRVYTKERKNGPSNEDIANIIKEKYNVEITRSTVNKIIKGKYAPRIIDF